MSLFPLTAAAFASLPGAEAEAAWAHLIQLEASFSTAGRRRNHLPGPGPWPGIPGQGRGRGEKEGSLSTGQDEFDVIVAGGGLSLVYAAVLARAGLRVCVFDRRRIGCGHREWNISRRELEPLVASGLFSDAEVERLILTQYRVGVCRFAGRGGAPGTNLEVRGVLDCVVDTAALLDGLRSRALAAGATLLDGHALVGYRVQADGVSVLVEPAAAGGAGPGFGPGPGLGPQRWLRARLLLDGLGAGSPHARFDLCCPTVGGVMDGLAIGRGLRELDPGVGEILVTTEGVEDGQQHIWEGFPAPSGHASGRPELGPSDRMTIYLFYYQRAEQVAAAVASDGHPLLMLYERFFATLPRYKVGPGGRPLRFAKPTYGYIPAYSRLRNMPASPEARVLLVGDAAARHSPLTFCGFGSMIRSFWPMSQGIVRCLREDRLRQPDLDGLWRTPGMEPPALQVMGGLTLMMMPPPGGLLEDPDSINELLGAAFSSLAELGEDVYAAFLQDSVDARTFIGFMWEAARRYPSVYRKVFENLTPIEIATWLKRLMNFRLSSASRAV